MDLKHTREFGIELEHSELQKLQLKTKASWNLEILEASLKNYNLSQPKVKFIDSMNFMELRYTKTNENWKSIELEDSYDTPVVAASYIEEKTI